MARIYLWVVSGALPPTAGLLPRLALPDVVAAAWALATCGVTCEPFTAALESRLVAADAGDARLQAEDAVNAACAVPPSPHFGVIAKRIETGARKWGKGYVVLPIVCSFFLASILAHGIFPEIPIISQKF